MSLSKFRWAAAALVVVLVSGPGVRAAQADKDIVMIDVDEGFQNFRYRHLVLVKRIIGAGTPSLKGNPIDLLEGNAKKSFFPNLWRAREALFSAFTPGELKA